MKRELERIDIPGEHEARVRTWELVQAAYAERERIPSDKVSLARWRVLVAVAVAAALAAAILSPPGRALLDEVREAIGVEQAAPALFDLPDGGRLLVQSDEGPWIVHPDGSKRLLGRYRHASWSPFGRFVVATGVGEAGTRVLYALDPKGNVRWSLARPSHIRFPRWGGSKTDTRIAYLSGDALRIVAGDGRGDRLFARGVAAVPVAWRPNTRHLLAHVVVGDRVVVADAETGRRFWSRKVPDVRRLEWSRDGELLLVQGRRSLLVFGAGGGLRFELLRPPAAPVVAATFAPSGRAVAFIQRTAGRSDVWMVPKLRPDGSAARRVFFGTGRFTDLAWSPDGRWLLVAWRDANQWVFVSVEGKRRIEAVSGIPAQFESSSFPRVEGWCCSAR